MFLAKRSSLFFTVPMTNKKGFIRLPFQAQNRETRGGIHKPSYDALTKEDLLKGKAHYG
jgi:hypothetical protein